MRRLLVSGAAVLAAGTVAVAAAGLASARVDKTHAPRPDIGHVFVINLENKGYDETFGAGSPAPYLSKELRDQGQLLTQYHGVAHASLGNYIAQISGQGP